MPANVVIALVVGFPALCCLVGILTSDVRRARAEPSRIAFAFAPPSKAPMTVVKLVEPVAVPERPLAEAVLRPPVPVPVTSPPPPVSEPPTDAWTPPPSVTQPPGRVAPWSQRPTYSSRPPTYVTVGVAIGVVAVAWKLLR